MINLKFVKENLEYVTEVLKERGYIGDLKEIIKLDEERRRFLTQLEELRHERNLTSTMIGDLILKGQDVTHLIDKMRSVNEKLKIIEEKTNLFNQKVLEVLMSIPNIPHKSVPKGKSAQENQEVRRCGQIRRFDFKVKDHLEIGTYLGIIDLPKGAKITTSRFSLLVGAGALLERALINFMLDTHRKKGYKEILVPYLANQQAMTNTGQLPKFKDDMYMCQDNLYLIPTAEVPLVNLHMDEILEEEDLPLCYTAYSPCFRREAIGYGKEQKGLIRQHQFDKVELVKFTTPSTSYFELEGLVNDAGEILRALELPYRVVNLCMGEMGFSAAKCYDIEVWMPSLNKYIEISSCSNCEDFQARRANTKYRCKKTKKAEYVHTLNGSGLAVGRTLAAILENYQQKDQSVIIPKVLQPYMDGMEVIKK